MHNHKKHIKKISIELGVHEDIVEAVVRSPFEFIRSNSKDLISVRLPNFGLFMVKPKRLEYLNESDK